MANDVFNNHKEKEQMRYAKGDKVIIKIRMSLALLHLVPIEAAVILQNKTRVSVAE